MATIAERNRIITIRRSITFKDASGTPQKAVDSTQTTYAKVRQITNSYLLQQIQVTFLEAYLFTVLYEPSRPIFPTDDILYNGRRHTINGIRPIEEGKKKELVIQAYTTNDEGEISLTPVMTSAKTEIHVIGNVVIGGSDYANWNGKILAFRDSMQYQVKRDNSAAEKEINYDSSTGLFTYPSLLPDLQQQEKTDIYFL